MNVNKKHNKNESEIINILEMPQIIYKDGKSDIFEAVHIAAEGVYTGRRRNHDEFICGGFIPKQSIKKIIGGTKRKIRKRNSKYYKKKEKERGFIGLVVNNALILDKKSDKNRRINKSIITARSHPH